MRKPIFLMAVMFILLCFLSGCSTSNKDKVAQENGINSNLFTHTPLPTYTPAPTFTPYPTLTPAIIKLQIPEKSDQEYWPTDPLGREFYAYVDIETNPRIPIQEFRKAYAEAVKKDEGWIKDPITLALRYAGYPNLDGLSPNQVFIYYVNDVQVIVIVRAFGHMDDSIRDTDERIELVKENGIWIIEWAGYRQRCYRSSFDGWTTGLCP